MNRLTTNKEVSEMSVIELAYNSCYVKDKKVRYRDYESDIDATELTIKLLEEHVDIPNDFTCDEDFSEFILYSLQYGTDDMLGLIALFYRNLCALADLRERLKEYEDLEEQGKLLKLPCAVGDTVYRIIPKTYRKIAELKIKEFVVCENGLCFRTDKTDFSYSCDEFGEYIFLTKEEAEAALREMNEKEGQ